MSKILSAEERRAIIAKDFLKNTNSVGKRYRWLGIKENNSNLKAKTDINRICDAVKYTRKKQRQGAYYFTSKGLHILETLDDKKLECGKKIDMSESVSKMLEALKDSKKAESMEGHEMNQACVEIPKLKNRFDFFISHFEDLKKEIDIYNKSNDEKKEKIRD